jgi:ABC-2 type transport system permease protein
VAPAVLGEPLADSDVRQAAAAVAGDLAGFSDLSVEGQAQAFLLQQFLLFGLLGPVLGSISLAAQAIIGEKQGRSLEPLLMTPLAVPELLIAKVLTPFAMSAVLLVLTFAIYLGCMTAWGEPGVWRTLFWGRTLLIYGLVGPLISLTALLTAAIVSSRVNDARTAQQLGGFLALPVTVLFVAQLSGQFLIGTPAIVATAVILALASLALLWVGVKVFQRETILIRWR